MTFITEIVFIVLTVAAVCCQEFNRRITFLKPAYADSDHQQSDSNTYISAFRQKPLENLRPFEVRNFQQKGVMNYNVQRQSSIYTPLNSFSTIGQPLSTSYFTPRPTSQQSSTYVSQSFRGSTFSNSQPNQLSHSVLLPLNCSKSSSTCLTPQPRHFSLTSPKSYRSSSRTGKQFCPSHKEGSGLIGRAGEGSTSSNITLSNCENITITTNHTSTFVNLGKIVGVQTESPTKAPIILPPRLPSQTTALPAIALPPTAPPILPFSGPPFPKPTIPPPKPAISQAGGYTYHIPERALMLPTPKGRSTFMTQKLNTYIPPQKTSPRPFPVFPTSSTVLYTRPTEQPRFTISKTYPSPQLTLPTRYTFPFFSTSSTVIYTRSTERPQFNITKTTEPPITERPGFTTSKTNDFADDDLNHPPHIHSLDVKCNKSMMTINIEFNRAFDGIIYSKGYYTNPKCIYVKQNSGRTQYIFTVNVGSCGTQFINDFEGAAGQAYLENVLILQNEPDIQEVWDTVQRVQCIWEGTVNKTVTMNLTVDMLNEKIVTFSGDTAVAKLDIQTGKGPFAPSAHGIVKIGETMTLVISVEGDPDFDLQVRNCWARDETATKVLPLTDKRGCNLKKKLFDAFQKTKNTGNTGASTIAYAFFKAFKFPDVMDLFIECNIELCKPTCPTESCQEQRVKLHSSMNAYNGTGGIDIKINHDPFGDSVKGFVDVEQDVTLVISVKVDPGFDMEVRNCTAQDETSVMPVLLTNERGCTVNQMFGPFTKTNMTRNLNASFIAYAFFKAFKFEGMEIIFQCTVEICGPNKNCKIYCPEANQPIKPGRYRRSLTHASLNSSTNSVRLSNPIHVGRRFKVILLDDLITASSQTLDNMEEMVVDKSKKDLHE